MSEARLTDIHKKLMQAGVRINFMLTKRRISRESLDVAIDLTQQALSRLQDMKEKLT